MCQDQTDTQVSESEEGYISVTGVLPSKLSPDFLGLEGRGSFFLIGCLICTLVLFLLVTGVSSPTYKTLYRRLRNRDEGCLPP